MPAEPINITTSGGTISGTPYCIKLLAKDEFQLRGNNCASPARTLTFTLDITTILGTVSCAYERTTVTGPVKGTFTTHPEDAIGHVAFGTNSEFKGESTNSGTCPPTGQLEMSFTFETDRTTSKEPI